MLVALFVVAAFVGGLVLSARSAPPSTAPGTADAPADRSPRGPGSDSGTGGSSPTDGHDDDQGLDEPLPDPEPDPDPIPDGPDDLAPNPDPEPTPPDDLAPHPGPEPETAGPDDVSAEPEPGYLEVHPNFAEVTLGEKGYENGEYVCFGNPGDLPVSWIVNDGVVIKSSPLNGELGGGAVTCPWVWTTHPAMEPGMTTNLMFESENNLIVLEITLAE